MISNIYSIILDPDDRWFSVSLNRICNSLKVFWVRSWSGWLCFVCGSWLESMVAFWSTYKCHVWLHPHSPNQNNSVLSMLAKWQFCRTFLRYGPHLFPCIFVVAYLWTISNLFIPACRPQFWGQHPWLALRTVCWTDGPSKPRNFPRYPSRETARASKHLKSLSLIYHGSAPVLFVYLLQPRNYSKSWLMLHWFFLYAWPCLLASYIFGRIWSNAECHLVDRLQPVLVIDVAAAVIAAIRDEGFSMGKTFELGGPDVFTVNELVRELMWWRVEYLPTWNNVLKILNLVFMSLYQWCLQYWIVVNSWV